MNLEREEDGNTEGRGHNHTLLLTRFMQMCHAGDGAPETRSYIRHKSNLRINVRQADVWPRHVRRGVAGLSCYLLPSVVFTCQQPWQEGEGHILSSCAHKHKQTLTSFLKDLRMIQWHLDGGHLSGLSRSKVWVSVYGFISLWKVPSPNWHFSTAKLNMNTLYILHKLIISPTLILPLKIDNKNCKSDIYINLVK